jgi:peptide/nickel transport system substrate-binding protein
LRLSRVIPVLILAGGLGVFLLARRPDSPVSSVNVARDEVTPGGLLRVSYKYEPSTYNRFVGADTAQDGLARLIHATLIRLNRATGQLEPRLAREWTNSPDGLTWTLKLREDVFFSDGTPFTAADVVFSFQALYDPKVKSQIGSSLLINDKPLTVRAKDAHTAVIILPAPYGPGISLLDAVPILPSHKLKAALDAGTFQDAWGLSTPLTDIVGMGPFVLTEYVSGQRMVLTRNPRFWLKDSRGRQLPYLDRIEIQFTADQNADVLRLQSGDVDVMFSTVRFEDLDALRKLEAQSRVKLHTAGVSIAPDLLWFNLEPNSSPARHRPWLQSEGLRKAISLAVDRQALVNRVFLGEAVPIAGPITPGHGEWYAADAVRPVLDRDAARRALAAAGLTDRNNDGMVDDAAGKTARFSILTLKGSTVRERSAAVIQEQLGQIGLQTNVVSMEFRSMINALGKGEYDAIYFAIESDSLDPARNGEFWSSGGAFHVWNPGQTKPSTTWEGQIDELMRRQATSMDSDERRRLLVEAERVLAEHMPVVVFAAPKVILATSARVRGVTPSVLAPYILWNADTLSVTGPPAK